MKMLPASLLLSLLFLVQAFAQQERNLSQLKLAAAIGDNMVLQQNQSSAIWGTATAGTKVSVDFAGQKAEATADESGDWRVEFKMPAANSTPQMMTVQARLKGELVTTTVKNILIGDVWICSGQSNMRMTVGRCLNPDEEKAAANFPLIRMFKVANKTAATEQSDCSGSWEVCTPSTVENFSGTGYFFGRELHQKLGIPIGLVDNAWGGKPVEAFTSSEKIKTIAAAQPLVAEWNQKESRHDAEKSQAAYETALAAWEKKVKELRAQAKADGKKPARQPRRPQLAVQPSLNPGYPSAIYNQMVAPWTSTGISGAIWYQGESNRGRAAQYRDLFPALIEDWRDQWGQPELPFYWVQLANFKESVEDANQDSEWAELQEAQTMTLKLPNTGMAIINDIGASKNIHPKNKQDVGRRLARWALAQHYGKDIGPVSGPLYDRHEVLDSASDTTSDTDSGKAIRVHLAHAGSGLKTRDGEAVGHFEIAGADKKYVWADASIDAGGKSVTVHSAKVAEPVAVRYAWADNPTQANLVNSAGLPTSLFRTDDWPRATAGRNTLAAASFNPVAIKARNDRFKKMGFEVLFDGMTTNGWRNPYDWGTVEVNNGEIHLTADKKFFLVAEKEYSDFKFVGEVHLPEGTANSGFMFRAHVEPNKVFGYQAEVDGSDRRWSGGLYDESRRGWVWPKKNDEKSLAHFAQDKVKNALKRNDWNRYEITCIGENITIKVNGVETTKIKDSLDAKGFLAIQHHGEKGAVYRFRNLVVRDLSKNK